MADSIVIAGYYGFENVGDDAVLTSMLADLRAAFPEAAYTVVGRSPERLEELFGVRGVAVDDFHGLSRAVAESRAVLLGGGGIFNDYLEYPDNLLLREEPGLISFGLVYGLPLLALLHEKPCMVFAAGASVINSPFARRDIGLCAAVSGAVTLRDARSAEILRALPPCGEKPLRVTADPAFRLRPRPGELCRRLFGNPTDSENLEGSENPEGSLPSPRLAVNLRHWPFHGDQAALETAVAGAINAFFAARPGSVCFLPFDTRADGELDDDAAVARRVAERLNPGLRREVLTGYLEPGEAAALIAGCDLALTMRLHPTVLAVRGSVPFAALAYDQKCAAILAQSGLEDYALDTAGLSAAALAARLEELWAGRDNRREALAAAARQAAAAAGENIEILKELLARPYSPPPEKYAPEVLDFFLSLARRPRPGHAALARRLMEEGHFQAARSALDSLPWETGEFYYLRAFCGQILKLGAPDILADYQRALDLGFSPFWVYYQRGQLQGRRPQERREDLARAFALNPGHEGLAALLGKGL